MRLSFTVPGVPQPKGSGSIVAGGHYIEAGTGPSRRKKTSWYSKVAEHALLALPGLASGLKIDSPVSASVLFRFPIPKSRLRGKRALKVGDPHVSKPDCDKLIRAIGDSLTRGRLIGDDALIWDWSATKVYATPGDEGAEIVLTW